MDEARKLKSILYPMSRDVRNLRTFISNINNTLQATPQRFAVAAPIGLASLRGSVRSLNQVTRALKEATDSTLQECQLATVQISAEDAERQPLVRLAELTGQLKPRADRAYNSVVRIEGYLNPVFVFMAVLIPVVEGMESAAGRIETNVLYFKKLFSRLVDQEQIAGLPLDAEKEMAELVPQLATLSAELADVAAQTGLMMGKMNRLQELSARLDVLLRMSAALNGSVPDLQPGLAVLKRWNAALAIGSPVSATLPTEGLLQLEMQLLQLMEQAVGPVVEPLHELAETLRNHAPDSHELKGIESTLVAQGVRLGHLNKLQKNLFQQLEPVTQRLQHLIHPA